jgi:Ca2+/Na+ antiporter
MSRKLKPDKNFIGLLPAFSSLIIFALSAAIAGPRVGLKVLGSIMVIYAFAFGLYGYMKTQNKAQLVVFIYLLTFGVLLFVLDIDELNSGRHFFNSDQAVILIIFYAVMIWMFFLLLRKKLKWRGREIYELAAWHVEPSDNSFTDRPRPVGNIEYTKYDILDFAAFLRRNQICLTSLDDNRILLVPVTNGDEYKFLYKSTSTFEPETWVAIDFDGNVSAHFAHWNYLNYRENLSLDQLCDSMGNLFIDFFDLYMRNEKVRIIDRLDSINTGLFS